METYTLKGLYKALKGFLAKDLHKTHKDLKKVLEYVREMPAIALGMDNVIVSIDYQKILDSNSIPEDLRKSGVYRAYKSGLVDGIGGTRNVPIYKAYRNGWISKDYYRAARHEILKKIFEK